MRYTYLLGSIIFIGLWAVIYVSRKDLRRPLLSTSYKAAIVGVIAEALFWTSDWWQPETVTGTRIGIEDFLFGFGLSGFTAFVYPFLTSIELQDDKGRELGYFALAMLVFVLGLTLPFFLGFPSWQSWIIGTLGGSVVILMHRTDLIQKSLVTAILLTGVVIPIYGLLNLVDPGFMMEWWKLNRLTGVFVLGVPLEDLIWFFTFALFLGPLYELYTGKRLESKNQGSEQSLI